MSNFSHPCYSLEDRRPRKPVAVLVLPLQPAANKHPDEEIGIAYRSVQPIPDYESLHHLHSLKENTPVKQAAEKRLPGPSYKEESNPWQKAINRAIETSSGVINLHNSNIDSIPRNVADLNYCVSLKPTSAFTPAPKLPKRSLSRATSSPLFPSSSPALSNSFLRSSSTALSFSDLKPNAAAPLMVYLSSNQLTEESFPSEFFGLGKLKVLSLRSNKLKVLSPRIGALKGLVELNLGVNQLSFLPAEILEMDSLETLTLHPNPWIRPPTPQSSSQKNARVLGPLIIHFTIPSLRESVSRSLLAPSPWEPDLKLIQDTYYTAQEIALFPPHLGRYFDAFFSSPSSLVTSHQSRGGGGTTSKQPFDPKAHVCTSPAHEHPISYTQHALERMEWVSMRDIVGQGSARMNGKEKLIPILHRGCGKGCLDWLEDEVESLSSDEEEDIQPSLR